MPPKDLAQIIKEAPLSPGVYLMKNTSGKVIYVGKAKALRKRLQSYFTSLKGQTLKTRKLIESIHSIDTILVKNEVEALLLERSLIRSHKPRFNILLRDDKSYPYLKADLKQKWPRIVVVRRREDDGAVYLGPFSCQKSLWSTLELVHRIFPLVRCSPYEFEHTKRPCNYYGMKLCWAPCHKDVDVKAYHNMVKEALEVLSGKRGSLKKKLKKKMLKASKEQNYPLAASYRDQLEALKNISKQQNSSYKTIMSGDVVSWHSHDDLISIYVLSIRDHVLVDSASFLLPSPLQESKEQLCAQFLLQYYAARVVPKKILLPFELENIDDLSLALNSSSTPKLRIPYYKEEQELMNTAQKNALLVLSNSYKESFSTEVYLKKATEELPVSLNLERMECFDISHLQGTAAVASMVCFQGGKPEKSSYRKYNISIQESDEACDHKRDQVLGGDDYGAIRAVMRRRLKRLSEEDTLPSVVVIDGGKGQLSSATKVRDQEFPQFSSIPFLAIAKAKNSVEGHERLFFENHPHPMVLEEGSFSYRLFTQIRNEAHRFAISHHRKRRKGERHSSQLEKVPGIGPALRKRLLEHFSSVSKLKAASTEELAKVPGISASKAEILYKSFQVEV